jgi:DNA topoisomerase-2
LAEIHYDWDATSNESISLAFHKKRTDDRKDWLSRYDPKRVLDVKAGARVTYTRFINDELIHYSNADNIRSIGHLMDGQKPSQRKVMYSCFKRGLRSEVKVAQLAGYVSEHSAYHHGEASLCAAIVGMAQNFVGSNNVNLLLPNGQFGSRLMGGKDAASARYIFTQLEVIADKVFRKEDMGILKYMTDDGTPVEPEYYLPTVPLLAINGCVGIGTGFSTDIPPHNPSEVVSALRKRMSGELNSLETLTLKPWWQGFKGTVTSGGDGCWITKGTYTLDDAARTLTITELPVGTWTKEYKGVLDSFCTATNKEDMPTAFDSDGHPILKSFDDLYTDDDVKFVLYLSDDYYEEIKAHPEDFEKRFKLTSSWRTTNMVAFDMDMKLVKYPTVGAILEAYYRPRLLAYEQRRLNEIERLKQEATELEAKARFIRAVLEGTLELRRATDEELVERLKAHSIPALSGHQDTVDGYDYVLRLRMDRVKASAVTDAEEAVKKAMNSVRQLESTTAEVLWLGELDEFEIAWRKLVDVRTEALASSTKRVKLKASKK